MTADRLSSDRTHMLWDSDLQYASMLRWDPERFVTIDSTVAWRRGIGLGARAVSKGLDRIPAWKRSTARRWMRDVGQIQAVRVRPGTEALYGHIVFPVSRPALPTVWSTAGVIDARPGIWFADQSAQTHAHLLPRADAVQCWSEFGKIGLLERLPRVDPDTITVLPPLVQLDLPPPMPRPPGDPVAIFIGANGALKGLDVVVAAAALVPDVRVEIITHTPPPARFSANVDWLGPRAHAEVLARLGSASVHVFPSTTESLGGVVVEALAAGVAQIVDGRSVTAEVAGAGGIAIDGRDPEATADALRRLAGDERLRATVAGAGLERYATTYAPDAVGRRLGELIDSI
ncbi:MAG: hypothetical protein QOI95_3532 [Acidimicrobiaceae bacterium]|jgi:glycosyltransferase involved in cell wall biosynthesis